MRLHNLTKCLKVKKYGLLLKPFYFKKVTKSTL